MKKKVISLLLAAVMICSLVPTAFADSGEATEAANALHELGLFDGTGTDANGNPIYDLDRVPTRAEAVTMLVRLLGKGEEAESGTWTTPFTDVADWAKPYVGYAYTNGLTSGTSATTYSGNDKITASQYLTFVLRALGYDSSSDFKWDKAWELSDQIGLTDGRYNAESTDFLRGDVAIISNNALEVPMKDSETTIYQSVVSSKLELGRVTDAGFSVWGEVPIPAETNTTEQLRLDGVPSGETLVWKSSDTSIATVENGTVTIKGKAGTVLISVTTSKGISKEQAFDVSVSAKEQEVDVSVSADDFYDKFHRAFTQELTISHLYTIVYNGNLSRAQFVEEFNFGSEQWETCAQRYAEEIVAKDQYASIISFFLPGTGFKEIFLGSVMYNDNNGSYSQWWESASKIADENY